MTHTQTLNISPDIITSVVAEMMRQLETLEDSLIRQIARDVASEMSNADYRASTAGLTNAKRIEKTQRKILNLATALEAMRHG